MTDRASRERPAVAAALRRTGGLRAAAVLAAARAGQGALAASPCSS